jgi:hypothetical protein
VKEACAHTEVCCEARWEIVENYREALGKQLLTPAPDIASVDWKRRRLRKIFIGVNGEWVEKSNRRRHCLRRCSPDEKLSLEQATQGG